MLAARRLAAVLPLALLAACAAASARSPQVIALAAQIGNSTAKDVLRLSGTLLNVALFRGALGRVQAPAIVRVIVMYVAAMWEPHAACHPAALGFLGARVPIAPTLCASPDAVHALAGLLAHRILRPAFSAEAGELAALLEALDIPHADLASTDRDTPQGWANARAAALHRYFDDDGWNARGDRTRAANRRPYADPTGYAPVNAPQAAPRFPLRWTPLLVDADRNGLFFSQVHSYPHIGWTARPLVVATGELHGRRVAGPYAAPDAEGALGAADNATVNAGLAELLAMQRALTPAQIHAARWWESKLVSLGLFPIYYERLLGLSEFDMLRLSLGDMLAQHDGIIASWRAKRAHDLVRPTTLMQGLRGGTRAAAYVGGEAGVREIDLAEWEPLLAAQPHSEFPSGSAALCRASLDHLHHFVQERVGSGREVPPFVLKSNEFLDAVGLQPPEPIRFDTMEQAYRNCGESRLWAGVHFRPAVDAGYEIVEGFGRAAFEHVRNLAAGRRPKICVRCVEG